MIAKKSAFKINDVMMYVAVAIEHLRLMVLLVCFSLLFGLVFYCFARPVYYSKSSIRLQSYSQPVDAQTIFHDSDMRAAMSLLESDNLLERAGHRLGGTGTGRWIRYMYLKSTKITSDGNGNLVLEIWPYSHRWAEELPEMLVKEYQIYREEKRMEKIKEKLTTYQNEMAEMRKKMDEEMNAKWDIRKTNEMVRIQIELNQLRTIPTELLIVDHHLRRMDEIRNSVNRAPDAPSKLSLLVKAETDVMLGDLKDSQLGVGDIVETDVAPGVASPHSNQNQNQKIIIMPENLPTPDRTWENLDEEARKLRGELAVKSRTFLPGHREIRKLKKELADVNEKVDMELQSKLNSFELEYNNFVGHKKELEAKLPQYDDAFKYFQSIERESAMFNSEQIDWSGMITAMSKQINEIAYAADKEHMDMEYGGFIEHVQDMPMSPNRMKVTLFSLIFGLALAISIPFLIAYLDNSVSDIEHVEETLRIRGMGVVPRIDDTAVNNLLSAGIDAKPAARPEYHLQENFRIIRTNLIMNSKEPHLPQVLLVTSAMPREGKTVVAANLAMSFASKGEKTLLIDGDLRRGRLHRLFNCQNKPGLSDVLSKYNQPSEAMRPSGNENLTIMTCGKHLNWASELLDNPGYEKLIEDLRGQYQRIIIDTPPVLGLSETSIMQRFCDGVLLVIWANHTQMPNIKDALLSLHSNGAKFSGFVLNRLDFSAFANRYKYFYYSPRYYTNYKAIEAVPAPAGGAES